MSFESDTEQSDVESIGSRTHICETELGSDEDEEDMYYSDPEGPYIDEPTTDEELCLTEYNPELEEIERRNQELQNRFDRIVEPELGKCSLNFSPFIISLKNLIVLRSYLADKRKE